MRRRVSRAKTVLSDVLRARRDRSVQDEEETERESVIGYTGYPNKNMNASKTQFIPESRKKKKKSAKVVQLVRKFVFSSPRARSVKHPRIVVRNHAAMCN